MKLSALVLVACLGLGCLGPTSIADVMLSSREIDPAVFPEWEIAQQILSSPPWSLPRSLDVRPDQFKWGAKETAFLCDGRESIGCYSPRFRLIQWNIQTPTVIRHEAGHAILHHLDDARYSCYEHEPRCVGEGVLTP